MAKTGQLKELPGTFESECFEHDLRWFSGGVECPLCKVEKELTALRAEVERGKRIEAAARGLFGNLPENEIEIAREAWGNTNTESILYLRNRLAAALEGR